jgi:hypothetical protein
MRKVDQRSEKGLRRKPWHSDVRKDEAGAGKSWPIPRPMGDIPRNPHGVFPMSLSRKPCPCANFLPSLLAHLSAGPGQPQIRVRDAGEPRRAAGIIRPDGEIFSAFQFARAPSRR